MTDRPENTISPALEPEICIVIRDPDGSLLDVNKFAILAEPIVRIVDRARLLLYDGGAIETNVGALVLPEKESSTMISEVMLRGPVPGMPHLARYLQLGDEISFDILVHTGSIHVADLDAEVVPLGRNRDRQLLCFETDPAVVIRIDSHAPAFQRRWLIVLG